MKISDILIIKAVKIGKLYLVKYFLVNNQFPKDFLASASESVNNELVRLILEQEGIDINARDI